jgi:hypothetical protein
MFSGLIRLSERVSDLFFRPDETKKLKEKIK